MNDLMKNLMKRETDRQFEIEKRKTEMKLIHPENEQYEYFMQVFDGKLSQIHDELESLNTKKPELEHFNQIWKDLHLLQKFVADSLLFLRDYDIKICQKHLQEIETKTRKLEENLLPKKKFGFKNKRPVTNHPVVNKDETDLIRKPAIKCSFFGFKNIENATLLMENNELLKKDVSLQFLDKCLVRLNGAPSTVHMTNLQNCVILCGPVFTSVFMENCTNCQIAIACQQLRCHSSKNCQIYLHVTSKAIIEDSQEIQTAEYNYNYPELSNDYKLSNLDQSINNWMKVEDFNWLVVDKASPNWSLLEPMKQIKDWSDFHL